MTDRDSTVRVTLRIPADLHEKLVKAASKDNRSMNAEIISLIQYALNEADEYESQYSIPDEDYSEPSLGGFKISSTSEEDIFRMELSEAIHHASKEAAEAVLKKLASALESDSANEGLAKAIKKSLAPAPLKAPQAIKNLTNKNKKVD